MNALFIHIPKTAGTSMDKSLGLLRVRFPSRFEANFKNEGQCSVGHLDVRKRLKSGRITKEFWDSAFKFCFCRNPFDRAVSHYFYARKRHPKLFPPSVSFLDYTRTLADYVSPARRRMFELQTWYTDGLDLDFIGRYENLEADFAYVAQKLGVKDAVLRRDNKTKHHPYKAYYDDESVDNVRRFYSKDFEYFRYSKDL